MIKKEKLSFTGHETFACRSYWLKKGVDFVQNKGLFGESAVVELGVGRNMVSSIRFWLRSFGMTDEQDVLLPIAEIIFDDTEGVDPYCEDKGTIWLLHYLLVTTRRASMYQIVFNHFRKERIEFSKKQLFEYLVLYCKKQEFTVHDTSIDRDIDVFLRNYVRKSQGKNIEENLSGILQELALVEKTGKYDSEDLYKIESSERADLPALIVLFGIARQMRGSASISFQELLNGFDSVGSVFALNANGLMLKIEELLLLFPQDIVFTDDGGIRLLQFKKQFSEIEILTHYYEAQFVTVG